MVYLDSISTCSYTFFIQYQASGGFMNSFPKTQKSDKSLRLADNEQEEEMLLAQNIS